MEFIKTKLELMKEFYNDQLYRQVQLETNCAYLGSKTLSHPDLISQKSKMENQLKEQKEICKFIMNEILELEESNDEIE